MDNFISVFGTAILIASVIGLIIGVIGMVVEKTPLKNKLVNMFNEDEEETL